MNLSNLTPDAFPSLLDPLSPVGWGPRRFAVSLRLDRTEFVGGVSIGFKTATPVMYPMSRIGWGYGPVNTDHRVQFWCFDPVLWYDPDANDPWVSSGLRHPRRAYRFYVTYTPQGRRLTFPPRSQPAFAASVAPMRRVTWFEPATPPTSGNGDLWFFYPELTQKIIYLQNLTKECVHLSRFQIDQPSPSFHIAYDYDNDGYMDPGAVGPIAIQLNTPYIGVDLTATLTMQVENEAGNNLLDSRITLHGLRDTRPANALVASLPATGTP